MRARFYYESHHRTVAREVKDYLNSVPEFLSVQTASSPRAVGDAIESMIADSFDKFLGTWCQDYSSDFARRAMADIAFVDSDGVYSVVDVKTHRQDSRFNMPNLTSVERLARFYESDRNVFSVLMVTYSVHGTSISVSDAVFSPIEFLDWDCLTVGALGWGQIQIANSNDIRVNEGYSRKTWMLQLCDVMADFYPREIRKIHDRGKRFDAVRDYWERKEDMWA